MNTIMNEMSSQGFMVYNTITNEFEKLYEMLHCIHDDKSLTSRH